MILLRQLLLSAALLSSLALLLWTQQLRIDLAEGNTVLAKRQASTAQADADRHKANANHLQTALNQEREAQALLNKNQRLLADALAARRQQIKDLKRANADLRDWAAVRLPDAARRLRERPALTGSDAYRQWLSGRNALPVAGNGAD